MLKRFRTKAGNGLRAVRASVRARADTFVREGFALGGGALIVYGVSLMHRPGAFLVAGAMCLAVAWGRCR